MSYEPSTTNYTQNSNGPNLRIFFMIKYCRCLKNRVGFVADHFSGLGNIAAIAAASWLLNSDAGL